MPGSLTIYLKNFLSFLLCSKPICFESYPNHHNLQLPTDLEVPQGFGMPRKQGLCVGTPDWNRGPQHRAAHAGVMAQAVCFCSSRVTPHITFLLCSFSFKIWASKHSRKPISISRWTKETAYYFELYSFKNTTITLGAVLLTLSQATNYKFQSINKH